MKKIILILIFISGIIQIGYSQVPVKVSNQTVIIDNQKFYLHKVEKGQTLYSLSKAYKISQDEIIKSNKLSSVEIKSGQLLKIPYTKDINKDTSPDFFYHKTIQGETLFSLSQKYFVSVEEIIESNPIVKYGLKTGEILKIPNSFKKKRNNEKEKFLLYTVKEGNTLFSISRTYSVSVDDLLRINPEATNGIKTGQTLKIPKSNIDKNTVITHDSIPVDTLNNLQKGLNDPLYFTEEGVTPCHQYEYSKGKSFKVILLLPLFTEKNLTYISRYNKEKDPMFYKNTKRFIEFYEGFLLALDKVKQQGLSVDLTVYDTENDSLKTTNIMRSLNYSDIDLIIGPVYSKNIKIASEFASLHHINLVSPLSKNPNLLYNNPFVYQVSPSTETRIDNLSRILREHSDSTNLILIYNGSDEQLKLINRFKANYTLYDTLHLLTDTSVFKIIKYDADIKLMDEQQAKINHSLKLNYKNIIYIPSDNEVFVTQVIDKLYAANDSMNIALIGSDKWINFQNINSAVFDKISFRFISPFFIDYNSPEVKNFIGIYRTTYETEPSFFAFQAYDIAYYFLNALRKYGKIFQFCLSEKDFFPNPHGLISNFKFERINSTGGFENKNSFILKFNDTFQLENQVFGQ